MWVLWPDRVFGLRYLILVLSQSQWKGVSPESQGMSCYVTRLNYFEVDSDHMGTFPTALSQIFLIKTKTILLIFKNSQFTCSDFRFLRQKKTLNLEINAWWFSFELPASPIKSLQILFGSQETSKNYIAFTSLRPWWEQRLGEGHAFCYHFNGSPAAFLVWVTFSLWVPSFPSGKQKVMKIKLI